ncbi:toprim domain-containing protein [bacterium]|nr:MAG: toprim domain-containing protein [bacterium]
MLYGADLARLRWPKSRRATLCEGYLDVIACHRAGVDDAVASLGTSLTDEQAKLFERFVDRVTILYDADAAGQKAAARAVEILSKTKVTVRIARMKAGDDPDTLLQREGPEAVRAAVEDAMSAYEFSLRQHEAELAPADPDFWPRAVTLLAAAPTEIELEAQLERIAALHPTVRDLRTAQEALRKDVGRLRAPAPESRPRRTGEFRAETPLKPLEIAIFGAIIRPDLRDQAWPVLDFASYMITEAAQDLARELQALFGDTPPTGEIDTWISDLSDANIDVLNTVTTDLRVRDLDIDVVSDSVERLGNRSRRLGVRRIKERATGGDDAAARDAIDQIRKTKPQ